MMAAKSSSGSSSNNGTAAPATTTTTVKSSHDWHFFAKSFLAGGVAGMTSKTTVAPLDRIKILLQVHNSHYKNFGVFSGLVAIVRQESFLSLYKGNGAQMVRIFPYAAVQFMSFEAYKRLLTGQLFNAGAATTATTTKDTGKVVNHELKFVAGSMAGVTSVLMTYPLDLVRARLASVVLPNANTNATVAKTTATNSKISASVLVSGSTGGGSGGTRGNGINAGLGGGNTGGLGNSIASGSGKFKLTTAATSATTNTTAPTTILGTLVHVFRHEGGITGLYRGITPTVLAMIPYGGCNFYMFERLKHMCVQYVPSVTCYRQLDNPDKLVLNVPAKLLCGGVAGAIGQTAIYPLDVARRRMQLSMTSAETAGLYSKSFLQTLIITYRTHGVVRGLYRGMSVNYIRAVPMVAVSFCTYEVFKQLLGLETGVNV